MNCVMIKENVLMHWEHHAQQYTTILIKSPVSFLMLLPLLTNTETVKHVTSTPFSLECLTETKHIIFSGFQTSQISGTIANNWHIKNMNKHKDRLTDK